MIIDFIIKIIAFFVGLFPQRTVVIDTETTDLHGELLQVSLVSGSGRVLFNKYIKPDSATEWKDAQKINKISPRKVKHCRHFSSYVPLVNAFLKHTKYVVGFNNQSFDLPLLRCYGVETEAEIIDIMLQDSDKQCAAGKGSRWRKLSVVAKAYGYLFTAHDSLEDCFATLHIHVLMNKGLVTILYFLRKIIRVLAGALLIISTYIFMPDIKNQLSDIAIAMPYVAASCWCYVYGPITGLLSTMIAMLYCVNGCMPLVPTICVLITLCIIYIYVKYPHIKLLKLFLCFAANIIAGVVGLILIPRLTGISNINLESMDVDAIIAGMAVCAPLYLVTDSLIKRIL